MSKKVQLPFLNLIFNFGTRGSAWTARLILLQPKKLSWTCLVICSLLIYYSLHYRTLLSARSALINLPKRPTRSSHQVTKPAAPPPDSEISIAEEIQPANKPEYQYEKRSSYLFMTLIRIQNSEKRKKIT